MGIPQLRSEGTDLSGTTATVTVNFTSFTWAANDIIEIVVATDGTIPTLSNAQGFQLAVDINGNAASVSTNTGAAGAAETAAVIFWKRALGSTSGTDPEPTIALNGATSWCLEPNSYSGCRTIGTPYHQIVTSTILAASTSVTSPSLTSTLANCLFLGLVSSAEDDSSFNDWVMTGSSGPSGSAPPSYGWHNGGGNHCAFTGTDGGFASAGGPHSATVTLATSTKQGLIGRILASLPEVFGPEDRDFRSQAPMSSQPVPAATMVHVHDELPVIAATMVDEDAGVVSPASTTLVAIATGVSDDEPPPIGGGFTVLDEDAPEPVVAMGWPRATAGVLVDDEFPVGASSVVDDDPAMSVSPPAVPAPTPFQMIGDEFVPGVAAAATIEEEYRSPWTPPVTNAAPPMIATRDDVVLPPTASGTGGSSDVQRSFEAPPQSGTLTTIAPIPAWVTSTAYVVDPTASGINRVQNGGTLYQCSQSGTSASSGAGPTSTTAGATVVDAGVHWYVVGPVAGTDTSAGSQILVTVMRGNQAQAGGSVDPTDNDSGAYTVITNNQYATFAGSFAGVWRRNTSSNTKTSFQASAFFGGSGGAGDEMSIGWLELKGVPVGAPHAFSHVERSSSTGGTVTAAAITTTKRCLIVSYWFGIGTVQAAGAPDTATPAGGLVLVANDSAPLSLTPNGYVQHMAAVRFANAGTFAEIWSATPTDQGAQLVTIAFEDLSTPSISVDEDTTMFPQVVARGWSPSPVMLQADEVSALELSALAGPDDDRGPVAIIAALAVPAAHADVDELPAVIAQLVSDDETATGIVPPPRVPAPPRADSAEMPTAAAAPPVAEDDASPMTTGPAPAPVLARVDADDAIPVALVVVDDVTVAVQVPALRPPRMRQPIDDEIAPAALDDAQWTFAPAWPVAPGLMPAWRLAASWWDDEPAVPIVLPPMIDEDGVMLVPRQVPAWIVSFASDEDAPFIALPPAPSVLAMWETRVIVTPRQAQPTVRSRRSR